MKIPDGLNEQDVLTVIDKVCTRLAYKFKFGSHSVEDIKQEGAIIALESLSKWDGKRPLENFLYTCVHNGLFNFKRNNFQRPDKPCLTCPLYRPNEPKDCSKYDDKMECELYIKWYNRNNNKKNIVQPVDIDNVRDEYEENMSLADATEIIEHKEVWTIIDRYLDIELRADLIKIKSGVKVPKQRRRAVESAITEILKEHINEPEER